MTIDELNETLENIRQALLSYKDAHFCRRCKKPMPSQVSGVYLKSQLGGLIEGESNEVWQVVWQGLELGWAYVEVSGNRTNRCWICPSCTGELLPWTDRQ